MNDAITAASELTQLATLFPDLSKRFVQWLHAGNNRPIRLDELKKRIDSNLQLSESILSTLEYLQQAAHGQQARTWSMRMQRLVAEQERLNDMRQEYAKLEPTRKRYSVHPTVFLDAIREFKKNSKRSKAQLFDLMSELITPPINM